MREYNNYWRKQKHIKMVDKTPENTNEEQKPGAVEKEEETQEKVTAYFKNESEQ